MPISREVLEKLYRSMSDEEIARQYGYSPRYILKLRLKYGLYKRRKWGRCPEIPREDLEKLYRTMGDDEIAKIYGTLVYCIKMLRLRYGLSRKRRACPEISREELEKMIDKTDREIAMIYNTKPHCITSNWKLRPSGRGGGQKTRQKILYGIKRGHELSTAPLIVPRARRRLDKIC
jgi:hypothetical protein